MPRCSHAIGSLVALALAACGVQATPACTPCVPEPGERGEQNAAEPEDEVLEESVQTDAAVSSWYAWLFDERSFDLRVRYEERERRSDRPARDASATFALQCVSERVPDHGALARTHCNVGDIDTQGFSAHRN